MELFTTRGVWISCRNVKDLDDAIARNCKWLWVPSGPSRPGEMPRVPPTPFNDDAWHSARREAILKGASCAESQPWMPSAASSCSFRQPRTTPAQWATTFSPTRRVPLSPVTGCTCLQTLRGVRSDGTHRGQLYGALLQLALGWSGLLDGEEEDGGEVKRAVASPHVPGPGVVSWPGGAMGYLGGGWRHQGLR